MKFNLENDPVTLYYDKPIMPIDQKSLPPTEKEAPTGLRIHLGGFFRGRTML